MPAQVERHALAERALAEFARVMTHIAQVIAMNCLQRPLFAGLIAY